MARFSSGDAHAARRDEVTELLEWFDLGAIEVASTAATTECLVGRVDAMADIARRVPTEVLLHSAGVPDFEYAGLRADVRAMVEVIGRGVPSSPASDVAVERLLERFRRHPAGPVAVVSVLYQSFDATAWLIGTSIVADAARGRPATTPSCRPCARRRKRRRSARSRSILEPSSNSTLPPPTSSSVPAHTSVPVGEWPR